MPRQFFKNPDRHDPYKNYRFLLFFEGSSDPVCGVSKVSALKWTAEVVKHRDGADPSTNRVSPGVVSFEPITCERGITQNNEFAEWAQKVYAGPEERRSLKDLRRDLQLHLLDEQGNPQKIFNIHRCWVSEYTAVPELDANSNAVAFEMLVIQNEGWVEDLEHEEIEET